MSPARATTPPPSPLHRRLLALWRAFDGTLVPGLWVGRSDAYTLPPLTNVEARIFHDSVGLETRADLHGIAEVDGERYAWVGVIHRGDDPAGESDVDRLFDAASAELAASLTDVVGVVPWLLSPTGVTAAARARLLEAGALFSAGEDVESLLEAFGLDEDPPSA